MTAQASIEPIKPKPRAGVFSTGLALFSMFFGAGNLIFPLLVGQTAGHQTPYAILGLGISAVVFPFLGLIAMMLYGGEILVFLNRIGKWPALILLFILQMSQGPMGAMPRLVTLMHASVKPYLPELSLFIFSLAACALVFLLTVRPQRIVALLGSILTPFLLATLGAIVFVGIFHAPAPEQVELSSSACFWHGLKMGYQTTDLIAALLFATIVMPHVAQGTDALSPEERSHVIRKRMKGASLIASGLLMVSYIGLCWISAHYAPLLDKSVPPEGILHLIAVQILGSWGGLVASAAVFLACLTTAISLAAVFSSYLKLDLPFLKFGDKGALLFTLGLTAALANLGFSGIVRFWGPVLEVLYPALIVLCVFNIAHCLYRVKPIQAPVFFTFGLCVGGFLF